MNTASAGHVALGVIAFLLVASACAKAPVPLPKAPASAGVTVEPLARPKTPEFGAREDHAPARAHLLGTIARKSIGPFTARGPNGGVVVWIATGEHGSGAELVVVPVGADGAPLSPPHVVASVPREATSLVVRPASDAGGWAVMWSALLDRGESLTLLHLQPDGSASATPVDLQRTNDHIAWADVVPTAHGALCIWAEETAADDANILTATLGPEGKPKGMPARVARRVERWATARAGDGAALALVTRGKGSTAGMLSWLRLDAEGLALGQPEAIGQEPTVSGDVEMVAFDEQWVLAWTDRTGEDPQVTIAAVDAKGHVRGPTRAMDAVGGSSLVALAAGAAGVALAWESAHGRSRPADLLHLARVSLLPELSAQPATSFEIVPQAPAELISTQDGFALLATPAPACLSAARSDASGPADVCRGVPTFVRYDTRLEPVQTEPVEPGEKAPKPATLAWDLRCVEGHCTALATTADSPTPVFSVDLPRRNSPFDAPAQATTAAGVTARVSSIVTLESGHAYIDLGAVRVGDTTLVASLTSPGEAHNEATRGRAASVRIRAFDASGRAIDAGSTLTSRAVPVGRVSIAAAPSVDGNAAAAWVSYNDGSPQVHVARVDGRGRRVKEVQVTTGKGDPGSVAIARAGDGWLVAWVDSRDGNGEVYAAKLDRNLNRVADDQRITRAPGDAADVSLAVRGDAAWIAWSDPRESPREGVGDIYVTQLQTRDAKRMGGEVLLLATAAHSRSPVVATTPTGALVAWVEDSPPNLEAPGAAMVAQLDADGRVVGSPHALVLGGEGRPTAVALGASPRGAQAVVVRSSRAGVTLDAVELSSQGESGPTWPVVDLEAPAPFDVVLALADGALVYDDIGTSAGNFRVRRVTFVW